MSLLLLFNQAGTGFVANISDSLAVADATPRGTIQKVLADSVTPADTVAVAVSTARTDSVGTGDSLGSGFGQQATLNDSVTPADGVPVRSLTVPIANNVALSDFATGVIARAAAVTDSVSFTDAAPRVTFGAHLADVLAAADAAPLTGAAQSQTVADAVTIVAGTPRQAISLLRADNVTLSDAAAGAFHFGKTIADSVSLADSLTSGMNLNALLSRGAFSGGLAGGTAVSLTGALLDTADCSDAFTATTVDSGFWTDLSTGSGTVSGLGGRGLRIDSGRTPGSVAGLRTVDTLGNLDVTLDLRSTVRTTPRAAQVVVGTSALQVDAGTRVELRVLANRESVLLQITATVGGTTTVAQTIVLAPAFAGPIALGFRWLRWGRRVIGFLNGARYIDTTWSSAACHLELRVANDATDVARATSTALAYTRFAAIAFGDEPVVDYLIRAGHHAVAQAPARALPGIVDIEAAGCNTTQIAPAAFRYTTGDQLAIGRNATQQLVILNDPRLRKR